ncbi:MAG: hypothetical protein JXC33_09800 [Deltaproteobacteria bacterium]|nr:hypothetical protein [Deltaproteobacteria bacterium]
MVNRKQKEWALDRAIEITKEFARGGTGNPPEYLLNMSYQTILAIMADMEKSEG